MTAAVSGARPWRRALLWLLFLGPFFFLSYGTSNWLASKQADVGSIVFNWEHYIPFYAWTIIPYWIIDILYVISLFICRSKRELDTHAKRLVTAQVIAVFFFVTFPLHFSFDRPETSGISGLLFTTLASFDKPYNQAPSLHIALLVILWVLYLRHLPGAYRWIFHATAILIGVSVLTTYQHHFIDIPTGALLGWFCIWVWPDAGRSPVAVRPKDHVKRRWRIAGYYMSGALGFIVLAILLGHAAWWLLWPAVSLVFVGCFYLFIGGEGFQKNKRGRMSLAAQWILYPYILAAKLNSRIWTRNDNAADHVVENVWLGRFPGKQHLKGNNYASVIDLSAELPACSTGIPWHAFPSLDLVTPDAAVLRQAAAQIEYSNKSGPALVSCALGYSRSALAVIAWLLTTGRSDSLDAAIARVKQARPALVLKKSDYQLLESIASAAGL